ncbi:hypothetical protein KBD61_04750 [Patescibacteria group bacterium]|nr:hypothetical protein [Patescibacteria group bacterium]MBP9710299.1 hypothetical protein [Patescibacteria group bacterium]
MFQQRMQGRMSEDDGVVISLGMKAQDTKMALVRRVIDHMREQLDSLERLLLQEEAADALQELAEVMSQQQSLAPQPFSSSSNSRVIEGVFDGIHMVGEDGKQYLVPPNYASKSKLVEGDLLRLVVTDNGRFIFKQRGPIERQRLMGVLTYNDQSDEWSVVADGRKFRVLTASVTYFKAQPNDETVILVPSGNPSSWAAVENVVRKDVGEFCV